MSIHPINGTENIEKTYKRYLMTAFHMNNSNFTRQFSKLLSEKDKFVKGPYLEITAPYQTGNSIEDLVAEGILSPGMKTLSQEDLPMDRPLYIHQEKAIRKSGERRNFVVATGTGSGKTESFLLPILNELFSQKKDGKLGPGVRALLIYPMNALANDQVKRLRGLLANNPEITFGRFTGETKESKLEANEYYRNQNDGKEPLSNELLSREEMRDSPPHILITNYAMLEYLLLRPSDTPLFDGQYSNEWKYIVLDEAHSYNGAKGIEVGMLLRRLKDRILKERPIRGSLQCIATSATLGSGDDSKRKVLKFAEALFDEPFRWDPLNRDNQDLIGAVRIKYEDVFNYWGSPDWKAYKYIKENIENSFIDKLENLIEYGYPPDLIEEIAHSYTDPNKILYELLKGDYNLCKLRENLNHKPKLLRLLTDDLVQSFYSSRGEYLETQLANELLTVFVDLAVRAKSHEADLPLLPARYHVFVRAIEGGYVSFLPEPTIYLDPQKYVIDGAKQYPVFEIGVCDGCGQVHIIGEEEDEKLIQQKGMNPDPELRFNAYMIVDSPESVESVVDEDEEILVGEDTSETELFEVCPGCATISRKGTLNRKKCCEQYGDVKPIVVTKEKIVKNKQAKCHNCGKRSENPIRLFVTGQDAATSVLATSLYQELVVTSASSNITKKEEIVVSSEDDLFDFIDSGHSSYSDSDSMNYHPQKLLIFSDSRQDAAFFAPYLERTYKQIMWRRLILESIEEINSTDLRLNNLVIFIKKRAEKAYLFDTGMSSIDKDRLIESFIMKELLHFDKRHSLEGVGLISFHVPIPEQFKGQLSKIAQKFGVKDFEVWPLFETLFDSFRIQNALTYPDNVDPSDQIFSPRNRRGYMTGYKSVSKAKVSSWLPAEGKMNRRLNYLVRIYKKKGKSEEEAKQFGTNLLKIIWDQLISSGKLPEYFEKTNVKDAGTVFAMSHRHWTIQYDNNQVWYQCSHCANWTVRNVESVCPNLKCEGILKEAKPADVLNHYQELYKSIIPMKMTTKEHTAQLSSTQATLYQQEFIDGKVNVLSCSTTFEMGVDVGGLESVFMRNVPPETANYVQRAGRAGRRRSSVAYSLTYAQRRSHDLSYYKKPEEIIAGEIKPPIFKMENVKIIQRHMHSVVFSAFFKDYPEYFGKLENFFRLDSETNEEEKGTEKVREFLLQKPSHVLKSLKRVIPDTLYNVYDLNNWGWVRTFSSKEKGILQKTKDIYEKDLKELYEMREENYKQQKDSSYMIKMIKTIKDKPLIGFLSSHNVLPKYGFPVDVVELQVRDKTADQVTLSRDLAIAVSEYAPGAKIVANGLIYKSVGLKRLANYELPSNQYIHCKSCGHYQTISRYNKSLVNEVVNCESCHTENKIKTFISPIFGFISRKETKPGEHRPAKMFRSRIFFSEYDIQDVENDLEVEGALKFGKINAVWKYSPFGKLAVVNEGKQRGYRICKICGADSNNTNQTTRHHKTPWGTNCSGQFEHVQLGHEFMSDVMELKFENMPVKPEKSDVFWNSLLYGMLDAISSILGMDRNDINGCIYYKNRVNPSIIIFDTVPGGAGYTKEVTQNLKEIIEKTLLILLDCTCGLETSCYGCLKNYSNQYCHDTLSRGAVIEVLEKVVGEKVSL
ncbi:DEAD/DEAH box helicase [Bacillus sp. NTK071]|uniref:DEAD/DEAH box helicase n=1 Tax=Bacillus sp. NTK071 TaxID=2802175 RepID=UPI001A8D1BC2|nr:DEAD/DEAH box helicase [Bacillus sp. NTK071]MBN8208917.1 DEAD/DEAH box helicase [Bacillus sp. NTK071]